MGHTGNKRRSYTKLTILKLLLSYTPLNALKTCNLSCRLFDYCAGITKAKVNVRATSYHKVDPFAPILGWKEQTHFGRLVQVLTTESFVDFISPS